MTIAILGRASNLEVERLESELETLGVESWVWETSAWPGSYPVAMTQQGETTRVRVDGRLVDSSTLDGLYVRSFGLDPRDVKYRDSISENPVAVLNQFREYRGVIESVVWWLADSGVPVINPPASFGAHKRKPWQLSALAAAGVPVPETCSTNDPDAVYGFTDRTDRTVYKPVGGDGNVAELEADDLEADRLSLLSNSPVQFQELVDGENLRLFVLDGSVIAAGHIVSENLDYRTEPHDVERLEPTTLESEITDAAITATERLGMTFAGVDVIRTEDRFVVLEANSAPMFATFDRLAGTDVGGRLAAHLAADATG